MRKLAIILLTIVATLTASADNLGFSKYRPVVIALDLDYAPLEYVDQEGLPKGLDVELTQTLMQRLDVPYTYRPNTWEAITGDVLNGRVDLAMMVFSPYRQSITNYSRAVFKLYYQVDSLYVQSSHHGHTDQGWCCAQRGARPAQSLTRLISR